MKALFLDRDGTLNLPIMRDGVPYSPRTLKEVDFFPDIEIALKLFRDLDFVPIIITNQPDVARKLVTKEKALEINRYIQERLGIEHAFACFHDDLDLCLCRKPKPGLIHEAMNLLKIEIKRSYMIGDRWKDVEAAQSVGCPAYFIDSGYTEQMPIEPYIRVSSVLEAAISVRNRHAI